MNTCLCPVPDDRCPRVAQLVLARPLVVMPQEEVIVERGEAVPAEDVSAALAHHLCAALVPLYGDAAPGAALDQARLFSGQVGPADTHTALRQCPVTGFRCVYYNVATS